MELDAFAAALLASDQPLDDKDGTPIEMLARIPLARELCMAADSGRPLVLEPGNGEVKRIFLELAKKLAFAVGAVATGNSRRHAGEETGRGGDGGTGNAIE